MRRQKEPFVSVVTPFYNSADYLEQCIKSVIAQEYDNWEYVLVNNCSTDGSEEIAADFAKHEPRIRIINNTEFLGQVQNYNHALTMISADSKYCKIVQADDWIYQECLRKMVDIMEGDDSIGMVSSYRLAGKAVWGETLPYPSFMIDGRQACRKYLLEGNNYFGTPTTMMFKSSIVRERKKFYDEESILEDVEVCFEILQYYNFGFVHQILVFTRMQEESISGSISSFGYDKLHWFILLKRYGKKFLGKQEYEKCYRNVKKQYLLYLGKQLLRRREGQFWNYHKQGLDMVNYSIEGMLPYYALKAILGLLANPGLSLQIILKKP